MNTNRDMEVNEAARNLLISACPVQLGMPAKLIRELVHGKYSFLTAEDVCSLSKDGWGLSMLDEYLDKQGYVFSWGTLSEVANPSDPDDDKSPAIFRFEFMPMELLLAFPQSAQLEDLLMWLYRNHPLYYPEFDCDEGDESWSVISFQSEEGGGETLRSWLANVFLPLIWHDLLGEATRIVQEKIKAAVAQSPDGSFHELLVEHDRCQLCIDPAELQFEVDAFLEEE
ncbi:hypothetical protein [Janthinobacterium sp. RB2R34]|uniref:hypothetical protein n=1 Tax=Janthinobacterium sp. RB2R34 TaxID=3424193 RepID=UPI003F229A6E